MSESAILWLCVVLCWPALMVDQVDSSAIRSVVAGELVAMRLPVRSRFCLALLPAQGVSSDAAADPSAELLSALTRAGMRVEKASRCYKALEGNVISVERVKEEGNRLWLKVEFSNVTNPQGRAFCRVVAAGRLRTGANSERHVGSSLVYVSFERSAAGADAESREEEKELDATTEEGLSESFARTGKNAFPTRDATHSLFNFRCNSARASNSGMAARSRGRPAARFAYSSPSSERTWHSRP